MPSVAVGELVWNTVFFLPCGLMLVYVGVTSRGYYVGFGLTLKQHFGILEQW